MTLKISVIGAGYLGATHAAAMAELGYEVVGVEINEHRLDLLRQGKLPFYEPGLEDVLAANTASGRLRFTDHAEEAAAWADIHFLCVGTPQEAGSNRADLSYLNSAVDVLARAIKPGALIVGKSTVPVGTTKAIRRRFLDASPDRIDVGFAWNPEFLREGFALEDTLHPDRIVVGIEDAEAEARLRQVYAPMITEGIPFLTTDFATAELVKTAANSFLATKISFINAMAEVCEAADADVTLLAEAIGHDVRIGSKFLQAGIGFGGGCLPKDIRAFGARAEELGVGQALAFLGEVDAINLRRRDRAVTLATELAGGSLEGVRVAVLGATFKPDSDDVRDSPALAVAGLLADAGADVHVHDPKGIAHARQVRPDLSYHELVVDAMRDSSVTLHLTEWREYRSVEPSELLGIVAKPNLVDGRNVLDLDLWARAGWTTRALGKPGSQGAAQ
jgi:UDPglucose 6-dehydrogenase